MTRKLDVSEADAVAERVGEEEVGSRRLRVLVVKWM